MLRADGQTLKSTMYLCFGHDSQSVECTQYSAAGWRRAKRDKIMRIRSTRREQRVQVNGRCGKRLNCQLGALQVARAEFKKQKQTNSKGIKKAISKGIKKRREKINRKATIKSNSMSRDDCSSTLDYIRDLTMSLAMDVYVRRRKRCIE
jgi:hypothetical protein